MNNEDLISFGHGEAEMLQQQVNDMVSVDESFETIISPFLREIDAQVARWKEHKCEAGPAAQAQHSLSNATAHVNLDTNTVTVGTDWSFNIGGIEGLPEPAAVGSAGEALNVLYRALAHVLGEVELLQEMSPKGFAEMVEKTVTEVSAQVG